MKEICIPVFLMDKNEVIEIKLDFNKRGSQFYRVQSFERESKQDQKITDETSRSFRRVTRLKKSIANYDENWELIQIFTPRQNENHIRVLYRKKIALW